MKLIQQNALFEEFEHSDELPLDEQGLLIAAWDAANYAYAPYSEFQVGCAILLTNGEIIIGSNQENIAFPSTMCAERSALFATSAQGKTELIAKMAIRVHYRKKLYDNPITPCGACRQVMADYEKRAKRNIIVLMQGETGKILRTTGIAQNLLPFSFSF
ncbi:MAG: cytidine deaminase [Bacteroidia bacterium]|nr:cytidine deaminase [Bacteroidia bacterium]